MSLVDDYLARTPRSRALYERATEKQCAAFADAHLAVAMMDERLGKNDDARKKYLEIRQNFPDSKAAETAMERLKKIP